MTEIDYDWERAPGADSEVSARGWVRARGGGSRRRVPAGLAGRPPRRRLSQVAGPRPLSPRDPRGSAAQTPTQGHGRRPRPEPAGRARRALGQGARGPLPIARERPRHHAPRESPLGRGARRNRDGQATQAVELRRPPVSVGRDRVHPARRPRSRTRAAAARGHGHVGSQRALLGRGGRADRGVGQADHRPRPASGVRDGAGAARRGSRRSIRRSHYRVQRSQGRRRAVRKRTGS